MPLQEDAPTWLFGLALVVLLGVGIAVYIVRRFFWKNEFAGQVLARANFHGIKYCFCDGKGRYTFLRNELSVSVWPHPTFPGRLSYAVWLKDGEGHSVSVYSSSTPVTEGGVLDVLYFYANTEIELFKAPQVARVPTFDGGHIMVRYIH